MDYSNLNENALEILVKLKEDENSHLRQQNLEVEDVLIKLLEKVSEEENNLRKLQTSEQNVCLFNEIHNLNEIMGDVTSSLSKYKDRRDLLLSNHLEENERTSEELKRNLEDLNNVTGEFSKEFSTENIDDMIKEIEENLESFNNDCEKYLKKLKQENDETESQISFFNQISGEQVCNLNNLKALLEERNNELETATKMNKEKETEIFELEKEIVKLETELKK